MSNTCALGDVDLTGVIFYLLGALNAGHFSLEEI